MEHDENRTVFVVGAGASKEVDLPVGRELTKAIAISLSFQVEHRQLQRGGDGSILTALQLADQEKVMDRRDHPLNALCPLCAAIGPEMQHRARSRFCRR